jgi:hypothetical protein
MQRERLQYQLFPRVLFSAANGFVLKSLICICSTWTHILTLIYQRSWHFKELTFLLPFVLCNWSTASAKLIWIRRFTSSVLNLPQDWRGCVLLRSSSIERERDCRVYVVRSTSDVLGVTPHISAILSLPPTSIVPCLSCCSFYLQIKTKTLRLALLCCNNLHIATVFWSSVYN